MNIPVEASGYLYYDGTTVFVNKLNIQDQQELDAAEKTLVSYRWIEYDKPTNKILNYDFASYCRIHFHLFQDIYDWAGQIRNCDVTIEQTEFCPAAEIIEKGEALFGRLRDFSSVNHNNKREVMSFISEFNAELTYLHPFHDGNARTQRLFSTMLIRSI